MLLKRTNLEKVLSRTAAHEDRAGKIMREVAEILRQDAKHGERVEAVIKKSDNILSNAFEFDQLETNRIYNLSHIRAICIDYRLRFLDSKYFKGDIPVQAIAEVKRLEKLHNTALGGFKILAPSRLFKLEDKDDPILFAPIGNGYYYLIHKWGKDLHPLRRMLVWPLKNIVNLASVVLLISFLITLMVPKGLFSKTASTAEFWIIFFFMFKSIAAVVIFYGFALGKNFNPAIWNSKYYNA